MKIILVTGSSGLIGSEVCKYFAAMGFTVHGLDNNQRRVFFGSHGDTRWVQNLLQESLTDFHHHELDIRDRSGVGKLIANIQPDLLVHAAGQPSHDLAADIVYEDFDTNAVGTLNLLEAVRQYSKNSVFVYMSTNKVYGDRPNTIKLKELPTRWEYDDVDYVNGISEDMSVDQSTHSLFGASKLAGDVLVQEYGRYFDIPSCCLRGGCLTGPAHAGVELHGFLSYLIKCNLSSNKYVVNGYGGKQVRDNIHSYDVARFIHAFYENPRVAEVYNLGGGKNNSCSIIEAFALVEELTAIKQVFDYDARNRCGDHICYYSDLRKMYDHYPKWRVEISLKETIKEIIEGWSRRLT